MLAAAAAGAGCESDNVGAPAAVADTVVDAPGATGEGFGDPRKAVNGVRGGGDGTGGTDVYSLGYGAGTNDTLVVRWSGRRVMDGPGPEVAVFENAFRIGSSGAVFMDPAVVAVSRDGETFVEFPRFYLAPDPRAYSADPRDWRGFAGITPVRWNLDSNDVYPFGGEAGGDTFDLADLPAGDPEADAIRSGGFRFLRIRSAATVVDPATGTTYPHDPAGTGPDIDGVAARYLEPE